MLASIARRAFSCSSVEAVRPPCRLTIGQPGPVSNKNGVKAPGRKRKKTANENGRARGPAASELISELF
jgi:hypothetical protein